MGMLNAAAATKFSYHLSPFISVTLAEVSEFREASE